MKKILLGVLAMFWVSAAGYAAEQVARSPGAPEPLTVTKVIDGATLELSNGETVRLIGVDVPTKLEKEAADFTRKLVEGKQVRLEFDMRKRDKYGRTLAYVYVLDLYKDGAIEVIQLLAGFYLSGNPKNPELFLNATLIGASYAQVMTVPPNVKYQELFVKLEKEAKEQRRGLWK